ncbi:MAG: DUF1073 domain-containing protein [Oscillospiraceae bacterium]|nr:DUF1073 domain-containing protein [Oscillospiraceae bacterium]
MEHVGNKPNKTVRTVDAFSNPMARLGYGTQNLMEATEYPLMRMTQNYALLNSLYCNNWVIQNIIGTIPEDVTKKWFRVSSNVSPEYLDKIAKIQRQTKLRKSVVKGMKWGRLYGGAIGLILIDGQDDMLDKPLDYDTIMPDSFKGLFIADRWSGVYPSIDLISDMSDPEYGLPEYYEIRDEDGIFAHRVHQSRVVRFTGRELPFWEKVVELYWGQSEIEAIYEEIVKRDNVSNNIASLTFKANLSVQEMKNLDQLFTLGGIEAQKRFWNLLHNQSVAESQLGVRLINQGDSFHQFQYAFSGIAEVYEQFLYDVAGAARIPFTKLYGRSPAGMNATGESDSRNYYDYLEEVRESSFRPVIEKLLPIMALSAWGEIPDDLDIQFDSMWTPTETEKASIVRDKVGALIEVFNAQGMTQEAFMKELRVLSTSTGMFDNITDEMIKQGEGVWQRDLVEMSDPFAGLMAGGSDGRFGEIGEYDDYSEDVRTTDDYNPNQPRSPDGKFGNGGGGAITSDSEKQSKINSINIDFDNDTILPNLNKETISDYGLPDKPILLKKGILEKNEGRHGEIPRSEYKNIIGSALYKPEAVISGNPNKPYYNFISRVGSDKSSVVLLDVKSSENNLEIVNFHLIGERQRKQKEKRGKK